MAPSTADRDDIPLMGRFTGCLLGGALGDALGWPIEFDSIEEIREQFGENGIQQPVPNGDGYFEITDDTQMTLFTAEGCLQAWTAARHCGPPPDFKGALYRAYRRWLHTQKQGGEAAGGWLLGLPQIHARRAPGKTCLSALCSDRVGSAQSPINDSKGCGGVMRAAPAGLIATRIVDGGDEDIARFAFELGSAAAAITHGHPSGYLPAGYLAGLVSALCRGMQFLPAVKLVLKILHKQQGCDETIAAIEQAIALYEDKETAPSPEAVEILGDGWVGEEALAISLYCSLAAEGDVVRGLLLSVNHSGDSDSTGSITGNILGTLYGEQSLPVTWLQHLELAGVTWQMGEDLYTSFAGTDVWLKRYLPA